MDNQKANTGKSLFDLENHFDLSLIRVKDLWVYPIIKQSFLTSALLTINDSPGRTKAASVKKINKYNRPLKSIFWSLKNKPLKNYDILLYEYAASRKHMADNNYYSIWTDFLYEILPFSILNFEKPLKGEKINHFKDINTQDIFYADFFITKTLVLSKLKKPDFTVDHSSIKPLFDFLDISYNAGRIESQLNKYFLYLEHFKRLLKKVKPRLIIINTGYEYSNMAMIHAAKTVKIKTVEFQHGIIHDKHPGYIYKKQYGRDLFTDYIFTYGRHFSKIISANSQMYLQQNIKTVGYPYLEKIYNDSVNLSPDLLKKCNDFKVLYFTSQWTIREELRDFVLKLAIILPLDFIIIYKTHPRENMIDAFYADFQKFENVILIKDTIVSSLEIMKISYIHSTVYSTSYFESLYFGLPNIFIYNKKFSDSIGHFIDNTYTYITESPENYLEILQTRITEHGAKNQVKEFSKEYFNPDPLSTMKNQIAELMSETYN